MKFKPFNIFGIVLLLFLLSCNQQEDEKYQKKSSTIIDHTDTSIFLFEEEIKMNSVAEKNTRDTTRVQNLKFDSQYQQEITRALVDTSLDDYYKLIYKHEKIISSDDSKMLSIADSLFIGDTEKDLFYFIVFTKSMNESDGLYSETLGYSCLEYITTNTEKFADYFNFSPKLHREDFKNWAGFVYGEICISRENKEKEAINELRKTLLSNIKNSNSHNKSLIRKFMMEIQNTMP